jgi:malonyl-CoA O-methyltransferase
MQATMEDILRVLKPAGLLMFSTFGPDTLKELRACWGQIDDAVHVNEFTDMHDVGDGLLQAGFADPVMEAEIITVNYESIDMLMADLRAIGANATAEGGRTGLTTPSVLAKLRQAYEAYRVDELLPASYEIVYGHAWKPVASEPEKHELRVNLTGL